MLEVRYQLKTKTHKIQFPRTPEGEKEARQYRIEHPEYKNAQLRTAEQPKAETIPLRTIIPITHVPSKLLQQ